eukprot:2344319-Prymnesium_polylepis.1
MVSGDTPPPVPRDGAVDAGDNHTLMLRALTNASVHFVRSSSEGAQAVRQKGAHTQTSTRPLFCFGKRHLSPLPQRPLPLPRPGPS